MAHKKDTSSIKTFTLKIWDEGKHHYRDLPWRNIDDPYAVLVSEVMLQQTQVARVQGRWEEWLEHFPTVRGLAQAPLEAILSLWQGMGYNRRAVNLKRTAEQIEREFNGVVPQEKKALLQLPGIGPATAAGVRIFAFQKLDIYLETNVRTVFLHEFFPEAQKVPDAELLDLIELTCPEESKIRAWYYALLDYGAYLKATHPNPSRRSKHYSKQNKFEGSNRQKRAFILRCILGHALLGDCANTTEILLEDLHAFETKAGFPFTTKQNLETLLKELHKDGFIHRTNAGWQINE